MLILLPYGQEIILTIILIIIGPSARNLVQVESNTK